MTDTAIVTHDERNELALKIDAALFKGDLSKLSDEERVVHMHRVCRDIGLNPNTQPIQYITLNGKLVPYVTKSGTDQLRKINGINLQIADRSLQEGLLTVHVKATDKTGRIDEDFGVVSVAGLRGEAAANAMMKAVTKGKRRVTLSISGLGYLDESEIDSIPGAERVEPFRHLTKPVTVADIPDKLASTVAPKNNKSMPPKDDADTDEPPIPTSDEYVQRWEILIENAVDPDKLLTQWKDEQLMRGEIDWPDSQIPPRLRDRVVAKRNRLQAGQT